MVPAFSLPLFVPADRPERFAKALASGADAVILDLEDAVAPGDKPRAREALLAAASALAASSVPVVVRVNAAGTPHHAADLQACATLRPAAVLLAKAEDAGSLGRVADATGVAVLALVESARGLAAARAMAASGVRLAFGSIDFAADLGCAHTRDVLLPARWELVLASRLGGVAPPLDGVTTAVRDPDAVEGDAAHAAALGFGGKLLIHPAQIAPAAAGFAPGAAEVAWAGRILAAGREGGAAMVDGAMVDAPVRLRAEAVERRAAALRRFSDKGPGQGGTMRPG